MSLAGLIRLERLFDKIAPALILTLGLSIAATIGVV